MAARPVSARREPRREELVLLERLLDGPLAIIDGPLGRCLKRGWCRRIVAGARPVDDPSHDREAPWRYALTDKGLSALVRAGRVVGHPLSLLHHTNQPEGNADAKQD